MFVHQLVSRGCATWSALPDFAQQKVNAAVEGWQAAAEEGHALAQHNLGTVFENGQIIREFSMDEIRANSVA
jgi:TPR repeat protein